MGRLETKRGIKWDNREKKGIWWKNMRWKRDEKKSQMKEWERKGRCDQKKRKEMNKKERSGLDDMRKMHEKREWRDEEITESKNGMKRIRWKTTKMKVKDEKERKKEWGDKYNREKRYGMKKKRWKKKREELMKRRDERKEWGDIQQKRGMRWRRDNREKEKTKEGCDEEKRWDWTRKNEVTDGMKKKRCKKKMSWRDNREKKMTKEGWDEKEEWTAEEREGWEKGMMFRRGCVQWGSIVCCTCGTCSDQCDDTNRRDKNDQRETELTAALPNTQHQRLTAINEACKPTPYKGSVRFRLDVTVTSTWARVQNFLNDFWKGESKQEQPNVSFAKACGHLQGEHNHHLDNHLQLCNVFHFKSTQWFVGRCEGRWVSSS